MCPRATPENPSHPSPQISTIPWRLVAESVERSTTARLDKTLDRHTVKTIRNKVRKFMSARERETKLPIPKEVHDSMCPVSMTCICSRNIGRMTIAWLDGKTESEISSWVLREILLKAYTTLFNISFSYILIYNKVFAIKVSGTCLLEITEIVAKINLNNESYLKWVGKADLEN